MTAWRPDPASPHQGKPRWATLRAIAGTLLKSADLKSLPLQVQEKIRQREWFNEIVLRSIQLTVISLFITIYTISPKTTSGDSLVFTPYFLGIYFIISLFGLIWALFKEPQDWTSYISIVFDFALLYGLMIGFHIQYEQPASFILKAPALLYVFIFIGIRSLRLNPKFVILSGIVAIAGWACVIVYVTQVDPGDNMLTRSYVQYLTSNSILIGAEVDKIMSIVFVTAILALAVNGARNLLVTAVSEGAAAASFARFFDTSVSDNIRTVGDRGLHHAEKRLATVLMLDIRGFSALAAAMDGDTVLQILTAYRGSVVPVIEKHNGIVDKFMGDGIMTVFGVGKSQERHAADSIRAAEAILRLCSDAASHKALVTPKGPLVIGIGIASGVVNWGVVGVGDRLEMTVIGPAVNLAAKLEKHNKVAASSCLVDEETWKLALSQGYRGGMAPRSSKATIPGIDEPVALFSLSVEFTGGSSFEA